MYGLKGVSSALDIKADGIHDGGYAPDGCSDRAILIDVAMDRLDPRDSTRKNRRDPVGMPRGDPNGKTGVMQVTNDASTEKSGSTKHCRRSSGHSAR